METLIINIDSKEKAESLKQFLSELKFVSNVKSVRKKTAMIDALLEHENMKKSILKRKNKAIAKYL